VSPAGAVLDPDGIAISTAAGHQGSPALAFDGTNYLVAWSESGDVIRGARVSPAGAVLDPGGFAVSTGSLGFPALAFDGTNYLAAWNQNGYDIYGARISPAGSVLDPGGFAISTGMIFRDEPALAFNGENYLVEWQQHLSGGYWDIYGARVSPAGTVLDPGGVPISTAAYNQQASTVASDGANYLVAWQDSRTGTGWDIDGGRVSPTGTVLDPGGIAITTVGGGQVSPALAFDGGNYFVAWQGHRSAFDAIYGARVSPAGAVLDPNGIEISPDLPPPPPPPPLPPPPPPQPPPPPPSARCRVPRVIGLRLGAAKRKIRQRRCSVGRIRRARSRRVGRVIGQRPRTGAIKPRGYPVALTVGRR
jgi:hypothetical protein